MTATELFKMKWEQKKTEINQETMDKDYCDWCGCEAFRDGLCWYHYQQEHYLSK